MLQKTVMCALIIFSPLFALETDDANDKSENPSRKIQLFSKTVTSCQSVFENLIPGTKRACLSLVFDIPTILRQVTGDSYTKIIHNLINGKTPYIGILAVHSAETFLRSQVIYKLYDFITKQTREFAPDLSKKYPMIPQMAATVAIAGSDVLCMNAPERIKVCLLNKRVIPFVSNRKLDWAVFLNSRSWLFTGGTLTFQTSFLHVGTFLTLKQLISPLIVKGDKPNFYESIQMGAVIAAAQTAITYPLLTFRAKLHDQQAELFNTGNDRISTTRFFTSFIEKINYFLCILGQCDA